jgi:hypothetical protein
MENKICDENDPHSIYDSSSMFLKTPKNKNYIGGNNGLGINNENYYMTSENKINNISPFFNKK